MDGELEFDTSLSICAIINTESNKTMLSSINKPENKKANQFVEELNKLLKKYQYELVPTLKYADAGILPTFQLKDIPPEEAKDKKKK